MTLRTRRAASSRAARGRRHWCTGLLVAGVAIGATAFAPGRTAVAGDDGAPDAARDTTIDATRAFVRVDVARDTWFVGERVRLRLRIGVDSEFFAARGVQPFRRELDVPVQVLAPWIAGVGALKPLASASAAGGRLLVVNDSVERASVVASERREGRDFAVVEIVRDFVASHAGDVTVPAPTVRYAYATRFDDDPILGRLAGDRLDAVATGAARTLHVVGLPAAGRPAAFSGAVGAFTVTASASPVDVEVGAHVQVTLRIEGDGDVTGFDPPRLAATPQFHVFGEIDDRASPTRTVVYDVAPRDADVREIPAFVLDYFDPDTTSYRTARTSALPITVRAARPSETTTPAARVPAAADPEHEGPGPARWIATVAALAAAAVVLTIIVRTKRAAPRPDLAAGRAPDAAAEFARAMDVPDADTGAALAGYLAVRLGVPPASVIGGDVAARLVAAGMRAELATRAATLLERLVAARYGGAPADSGAVADARAVVAAIEREFAPTHRG